MTLNMNLCPFCHTGHQAVERSMYDSTGKFIQNEALRTSWIVKCTRCGAKSKNGRSKLDAIAKWNRQDFTYLTYVMNRHGYVGDYDIWITGRTDNRGKVYGLATAIIEMQATDLSKVAISRHKQNNLRGKLPGEDWFYSEGYERLSSVPGKTIVRLVKEQAPYDLWRERHGCKSCKLTCYHKTAQHWKEFRDGKAPDCPAGKEIPKTKEGKLDVKGLLEQAKKEMI